MRFFDSFVSRNPTSMAAIPNHSIVCSSRCNTQSPLRRRESKGVALLFHDSHRDRPSLRSSSFNPRFPFSESSGITSVGIRRSCMDAVRVSASSAQTMEPAKPVSSPTLETIVDVDLGNRSYPIYIGSGLLREPQFLQR